MDEFVKSRVMQGAEFIVNEDTHDIYYLIPGVFRYYLRHDGRIIHYDDVEVEVMQNLSDCYFDSFPEAANFMEFFGAAVNPNRPDTYYIGSVLESNNKVFGALIEYANTKDVEMMSNVLIVADEIKKGQWIYRPMVSKDCSFNIYDDSRKLSIQSVMSLVLKPIPELPDCYRITGSAVQKLIQIQLKPTNISGNSLLKFSVAPMDIDHVDSIKDFRFYNVDQIVFALKIFGARDVMAYDDYVELDKRKYHQQYIRYFNKDDNEITLYITEENAGDILQKVCRIHELV